METITISKAQYERLKVLDKNVDWKLVDDFREGLKDLKEGKFIEC